MQKPNLNIMQAAIEIAEKYKTPFGAVLAMGDEVFVTAANQTKELNDPTAHAEILAVRRLADHIKKTDLSGFTMYTTCEPCPMCMSAIIWAGIGTLFYGCSISDASKYTQQLQLSSESLNKYSFHKVDIRKHIQREQCLELLQKFCSK